MLMFEHHRCSFSAILMLMNSPIMKRIISLEYAVATVAVIVFYLNLGQFAWYWLPVALVAFDISMIGYLINPRIGALCYNIGHSIIGPALLMVAYIFTEDQAMLFISLLWLFHIFADRTMGYGMKHETGFQHTHLGHIGKS